MTLEKLQITGIGNTFPQRKVIMGVLEISHTTVLHIILVNLGSTKTHILAVIMVWYKQFRLALIPSFLWQSWFALRSF